MHSNRQASSKRSTQVISDGGMSRRSRSRRHSEAISTFIIAAMIVATALVGCGVKKPPIPAITTDPSRKDIIQAVRRSVEGHTYTVTTTRQQATLHTCSQLDVDFDPYMPRNPELAKCPYVGATYSTWETVPERETRTCKPLPGPEYGWYVEEVGNDKWRVSRSGSVWDVEKRDGASASVDEFVKVSGFVFVIKAHQDC